MSRRQKSEVRRVIEQQSSRAAEQQFIENDKKPTALLRYCSTALILLFTIHYSLFTELAFADIKIKVLLVDNMNPKIPAGDEKLERLANTNGEVLLSGTNYAGIIEVWKGKNGIYIVNEVPLEEYIKGVVAAEVGKNWDLEAMKAQAVAARTYAVYQMLHNGSRNIPFHLTSSVLHQVYKRGKFSDNVIKAVNDTKGEILTFDGRPILAFYHSTSGGATEEAAEVFGKNFPYLKPVETNSEISPYHIWERKIPLSEIERAVGINGIREVIIDSYTVTNRVRNLRIVNGSVQHLISAKDLRRDLGWDKLPSTLITGITKNRDSYTFAGKGYGHGVGMCQWSALNMAMSGTDYRGILSKFYPGATIQLL